MDAEPYNDADANAPDTDIAWYRDPGVVRPLEFYECDGEKSDLSYGLPILPYIVPEGYDFASEPLSYELLEARAPADGSSSARTIFLGGPEVNAHAFMTSVNHSVDQDLRIKIGFAFGREPDPANRWIGTVLVDYEPVALLFEFPADEGNDVSPPQQGSGFDADWPNNRGIVEFTIPGSAFSEPGFHEVLVRTAVRRPGAYPYDLARRMSVWVETNERRPHPCFQRADTPVPLPAELGENIRAAFLSFDRQVMLVPRDIVAPADIDEEIVVAAGQVIEFDYYVVGERRAYEEWGFPEVILPAVNGEPIGEAEYYVTEKPLDLEPFDVMHQGTFTYTAPEEPGIYDVEMIQARDAYIPFMGWNHDFNLYPYPAPIGGAKQHQGSHIIRLRVPD